MPRNTPLAVGDCLPAVALLAPDGTATTLDLLLGTRATLIYFMRTANCAACHQHLRQIERTVDDFAPLPPNTVVVVPGGPAEAASVERRHPRLAGRIFASESAHEEFGLFVRVGLQQSGGFVVGSDLKVIQAKTATIPTRSFSIEDAVEAFMALPATP